MREGHFKRGTVRRTLASIQYTEYSIQYTVCSIQYTVYNIQYTLTISTLVLQIPNCKRVYKLCIVMRRNVLFDRCMT